MKVVRAGVEADLVAAVTTVTACALTASSLATLPGIVLRKVHVDVVEEVAALLVVPHATAVGKMGTSLETVLPNHPLVASKAVLLVVVVAAAVVATTAEKKATMPVTAASDSRGMTTATDVASLAISNESALLKKPHRQPFVTQRVFCLGTIL